MSGDRKDPPGGDLAPTVDAATVDAAVALVAELDGTYDRTPAEVAELATYLSFAIAELRELDRGVVDASNERGGFDSVPRLRAAVDALTMTADQLWADWEAAGRPRLLTNPSTGTPRYWHRVHVNVVRLRAELETAVWRVAVESHRWVRVSATDGYGDEAWWSIWRDVLARRWMANLRRGPRDGFLHTRELARSARRELAIASVSARSPSGALHRELVARKDHRCEWECGDLIKAGSRYVRSSLPPWTDVNESAHWWSHALHGHSRHDCPAHRRA